MYKIITVRAKGCECCEGSRKAFSFLLAYSCLIVGKCFLLPSELIPIPQPIGIYLRHTMVNLEGVTKSAEQ